MNRKAAFVLTALLLSSSLATAADKPAKPREKPQLTVTLKVFPPSSPRWTVKDRVKGGSLRVTSHDADSCTAWVSSAELLQAAFDACEKAVSMDRVEGSRK